MKNNILIGMLTLLITLSMSFAQYSEKYEANKVNSSQYDTVLQNYKDTSAKIITYFDITNPDGRDPNAPNFIVHVKCPNSWNYDDGVYFNENGWTMLVGQTLKKIGENKEFDETAYKYTYRNNDGYDFKDTECISGINDKKNPYIFYKNPDSFTGYIVFKFYEEYVSCLSIIDCPNEEVMNNIINSVYLEKQE